MKEIALDEIPSSSKSLGPRTEPVGDCPLCGSHRSEIFFSAADRLHGTPGIFTYKRCVHCHTVFQDPRVTSEDQHLCYPSNYYTHAHQENFSISNECQRKTRGISRGNLERIREKVRQAVIAEVQGTRVPGIWSIAGRILSMNSSLRARSFYGHVPDELLPRNPRFRKALEIGCGSGFRLTGLRRVGWDVEGVEIDPVAADTARRSSGCAIWQGDFRKLNLPLGVYGLVFLHHVFEHLDNPIESLYRIRDLLVVGGRAVLVYPNPNALGAKVFGDAWYPWEVPRHLVIPPARSLISAADKVGFHLVQSKFSAIFATEYFAYSRCLKAERIKDEWHPNINKLDLLLTELEKLLLFLKFGIGEEIRIVLQKR